MKEAVLRWFGGRGPVSTVPSPQTLLRAIYVGRICVAVAIYLTTALKVAVAQPLDILLTSFLLIAALLFTAASYWRSHVRGRSPTPTFLYLQALFDAALITTVVHMTGGSESDFATLYVPLIAVIAVLMPPSSTALVTTLVGMVYFADIAFGHRGAIGPGLWIQLSVFVAVAAVTAYFSSRIKVMGVEHEALAGELQQVRLEADDVLRNLRTGVLTVDGSGKLLYSNPAAEELLGFRAEDWRGRPIMPELARLAPEFWAALTATARRGVRLMRVEARVHRAGGVFPIGLTTTTIEGPRGEPPRVTAIFADISDSKRLQELHLRAERLEAVAELSSSLAHEIKNPLASIRSSVEQLVPLHPRQRGRAVSGGAHRPGERPAVAPAVGVSGFLAGPGHRVSARWTWPRSRRRPPAWCRSGRISRRTREVRLEGGPTPMEGDEDLLHRVVSNLVLNAVQATGAGARIVVRTERVTPRRAPQRGGDRQPRGAPHFRQWPRDSRGGAGASLRALRHRDGSAARAWAWPSCSAPWRRIAGW